MSITGESVLSVLEHYPFGVILVNVPTFLLRVLNQDWCLADIVTAIDMVIVMPFYGLIGNSWMLKVLLCFYGEMIRWKPHMHAQAHSLSLTLTHSYKSTVFLDWCMTGIKWLKSNPLETNIPCVPSGMSWPCATLRYVLTAHKHTDLQSKEDFFSSFVFLVQPSWTEGFSNLC